MECYTFIVFIHSSLLPLSGNVAVLYFEEGSIQVIPYTSHICDYKKSLSLYSRGIISCF